MKSGFAVLVGRSNVGKSTLLNNLIGSKVAITTPKAQTTRHAIHGVFTDDEIGQIVFVDTPGLLQKRDVLTKRLLHILKDSLEDVDVILYVVDATRDIGDEEKAVGRIVREAIREKPGKAGSGPAGILVINKIDSRKADAIDFYRDMREEFDAVVEVSALRGTHLETLRETIFNFLPEGEPFYPKGQMTNLTNDQLIGELIREKVFLRLHEEVPYSTHVVVDQIEDRPDGTLYIKANIVTSEERHKGIIVGKGGRGIREVGQSARKDLENITQKKVYLDLTVELDERWVERLS